jgi:peptide/nickel transport system permease protein
MQIAYPAKRRTFFMLQFTIQRSGSALLLILVVSFVAFALVFVAGDPAVTLAGSAATAADADIVRKAYGFDRPLLVQFANWLLHVTQGDLGKSLYFQQPVAPILVSRFLTTLTLGLCAIIFALVIAIPLGIMAARWQNTLIDRIALTIAVVGQAMPTFWFALVLIILFSVKYPILPTSGFESWRHMVLPTVVLGYFAMPALMRLTRSGMIATLQTDFIRTARAMGLSSRKIVFQYALRNAALPVVSLAAAQFGFMLAGSVVVESVFAIPGAGRLAWESILRSDLPMIQALVLCFSVLYVVLTFAADVVNALLDPRLRQSA